MQQGTSREVSIHVEASPTEVYDIVSDVPRMGEWSPETVKCEWLDGATGPAVGARFKGTNKRGIARWSTKPEVAVAEPGREFAFVVDDKTKWSYKFEPDGSGTRVVESFELLRDLPWYYRVIDRVIMGVSDRGADLEAAMSTTLERIKHAVERTSAS